MRLFKYREPAVWKWSAFDQLTTVRDEINRLFENPATNRGTGNSDVFNEWAPPLDLYEDKDSLILRAELPGLKRENIEVTLHENTVTLSCERRNEKQVPDAETAREERVYGRFNRSLQLPKAVDGTRVKASYKDGILTVILPKAEEAKPRQIEIETK